jgi:hypothetical protein
LTYPSEKYARQLGLFFPIYGKIIQMFQTTNQSFFIDVYSPKLEVLAVLIHTCKISPRLATGGPSGVTSPIWQVPIQGILPFINGL